MLTLFRKNFIPIPLIQEITSTGCPRVTELLGVADEFDGRELIAVNENGDAFLDFEKINEMCIKVYEKITPKYIADYLKKFKRLVAEFNLQSRLMDVKSKKRGLYGLINDMDRWLGYLEHYTSYPMSTKFLPQVVEQKIRNSSTNYSPEELGILLDVGNRSPVLNYVCNSLQLYIDLKKGKKVGLRKFLKKYSGTGADDIELLKFGDEKSIKEMLKDSYSYLTLEEAEIKLESLKSKMEEKVGIQRKLLQKAPKEVKMLIESYWNLQVILDTETAIWTKNYYHHVRPMLKRLSAELVKRKIIKTPEDIFMIKRSELGLLGKISLKEKIEERMERYCKTAKEREISKPRIALRRMIV